MGFESAQKKAMFLRVFQRNGAHPRGPIPPPGLGLLLALLAASALFSPCAAQECDISQGWWSRAPRPYYYRCPLFTCPTMNNTRITKYFWRSPGCQQRTLQPYPLMLLLRNKVMAFVGDSISKNLYASVACRAMSQFRARPIDPYSWGYPSNRTLQGYHFPAFNATIINVLSPFWVSQIKAPKGKLQAVRLDRVDYMWAKILNQTNYIVFGGGRGFLRPSTAFYKGSSLKDTMNHVEAVGNASKTMKNYIKKQNYTGTPVLFTFPPDHLGGIIDPVNSRIGCWGAYRPMDKLEETYAQRINKAVAIRQRQIKALKGSKFLIGDITRLSLLRPDGHPASPGIKNGYPADCSHWCLPGIPDTWADVLFSLTTKLI